MRIHGVLRICLTIFMMLLAWMPMAGAAPPSTLVVFVHGRYENASGADWIDDSPARDGEIVAFVVPGPFGNIPFRGVKVGATTVKRVRENYWILDEKAPWVAASIERAVGRANTFYARYDARDSFYYEAKAAPMVAREVRAWLNADAGRKANLQNLVWIAHSNGGIVVRGLMSEPKLYADLIARTRKVITLGTPHLGSEMADASIDGGRIQAFTQTLVDADGTVAGPAQFLGQKFSIFDLAGQVLKPRLEKVKAETEAEAAKKGWNASEKRKQVRLAQATVMATAFDQMLSGRIDEQLTTPFMQRTASSEHVLLPTAELPVKFFWVRGDIYPIDFGAAVGRMFGKNGWTPEDMQYFITSAAIMNPRLAKEYPKDRASRRSDGVVSIESAAAVGEPLGGDPKGATFRVHHGGLLADPKIEALVKANL